MGTQAAANRSGVSVLGEIAAMSFAKTLTGIPYSPYVMDAFLVYGYSPEAASGLYEEMMEKTGRTPRLPEAVDTDAPPRLYRNNAYRKVRI